MARRQAFVSNAISDPRQGDSLPSSIPCMNDSISDSPAEGLSGHRGTVCMTAVCTEGDGETIESKESASMPRRIPERAIVKHGVLISMFENIPLDWTEYDKVKKSGGVRHICAPNEELKRAQRSILRYLEGAVRDCPEIRPSVFAHGFVPYHNTATCVLQHDPLSPLVIGVDVADFFDNMPVDYVANRLVSAGISAQYVDDIMRLCTLRGTFPQGGPCSPMLTNIGMVEADRMIYAMASSVGLRYTRYADDMIFSVDPYGFCDLSKFDKDPVWLYRKIDRILQHKLGLKLNPAKSHVIWLRGSEKRQVLGITIRKDGRGYNIPKKVRRQVRAAVHEFSCEMAGRPPQEPDRRRWMRLKGIVAYSDYVRSNSMDEEASSADPKINAREWKFLKEVFNGRV